MTTAKSSLSLQNVKPEDLLWFHRALTLSQILQYLTSGTESALSVTNDAISDAAQTLTAPSIHSRLLVLSGIPKKISKKDVLTALRKVCYSCGGIFKNEMFLPTETLADAQKKVATDRPAVANVELPALDETIKGYAVLELRSKTKLDAARKAIFKNKALLAGFDFMLTGMDFDPADMQEEMLSVSSVNQNLFSDPQGNPALEHYLSDKILTSSMDLADQAMIALTEVFHSCFISEQRVGVSDGRHESGGFICLTKDQIMMQTPGNLLGSFMSHIRAPKKTLAEQVSYVLKHYGVPKFLDKEE
jgi:E3 ubiquitin-protein ligase HECTD4